MKVRKGFVSNSSSSSFTCDACNELVEGWDVFGKDCDNGHTFCEDCQPDTTKVVEDILKLAETDPDACALKLGISVERLKRLEADENLEDWLTEDGFPFEACPFCRLEDITQSDLAHYLQKVSDITWEQVFTLIKQANKRRKKLYDHEYISHVCGVQGTTPAKLLSEIREKFDSYDLLVAFLRG